MKWFMRFAISFFILCLVIFSFAYFFGPQSIRQSIKNPASPVGQLNESVDLKTPGQATESGTTTGATSAPSAQ